MKINKTHSGIVLSDQLPVGQVLKKVNEVIFFLLKRGYEKQIRIS